MLIVSVATYLPDPQLPLRLRGLVGRQVNHACPEDLADSALHTIGYLAILSCHQSKFLSEDGQ